MATLSMGVFRQSGKSLQICNCGLNIKFVYKRLCNPVTSPVPLACWYFLFRVSAQPFDKLSLNFIHSCSGQEELHLSVCALVKFLYTA